jgi:hypothetical protein
MKKDYRQFFAMLHKLPHVDKEELVLQFTDGRTTHLNEMKAKEYMQMIGAMEEASAPSQAELKRWRSSALLRIGRLGINTIDNWDGINSFVSSKKIAGKPFYELKIPELQQLVRKLEAIERKGGLKAVEKEPEEVSAEAIQMAKWFQRPSIVS